MNRKAVTATALAMVLGASLTTTGCAPRTTTGGAVVGGAAVGGVYEYQNKRALDALEQQFRRGEITREEYDRRRREISRRSLIY
jgi:hypothetical protein